MTSSFEIIFKQKIKYANILFSISLFYLLGIFVFNSNISRVNETEKTLKNSFDYRIDRVKRIEQFENNKKEFVKKYIFLQIQEDNFVTFEDNFKLGISYLHHYNSKYFQPEHNIESKIPQVNKDSINGIINNCELFSKKFNSIIVKNKLSDIELSSIIKQNLDSIFDNKKISKLLDDKWVSSLVNLVKNPNDSNNKINFLNYILTESIRGYPMGGTYGSTGGRYKKNSYINNYKSEISPRTEGQFYYFYLKNKDIDKIKEFLINDLKLSYTELSNYKSTEKKLSTNIIGVNIDFNYIFLFSGLVLFFFLTLFYIYHRIDSKEIENDKIQPEYLFPNFGIRTSPFQNLFSRKKSSLNFNYYFTNSVWLIFLLLPIVILFIGYIFRYNLTDLSFDGYNLEMLLYSKQSDFLSFIGDLVNIVALFFSVWVFIDLTLLNDKKIRPIEKVNFNKWLFIISIVLFIVLSYFNILPNYTYFNDGIGFLAIFTNYLFLLQIIVWFILCCYSMLNSSFFGIILSFIAIYINLSLFLI